MTNVKHTKKALLASCLSMLLCCAMLIGTTFAWFTDSASTGVNKIQAGTLDIDILDEEGNSLDGQILSFKNVNGSAEILWEPGCTYNLESFKIVNKGDLALKYKVTITGILGNAKLNEAIDWTMSDGAGTTLQLDTDLSLAPKQETGLYTISGHMKETAGNEYQGLSIDGIAITVVARQDTVEFDNEDNQYDADAVYPIVSDSSFADALATGGNIVLGSDVNLAEDITNDVNIDLSGYTIAPTHSHKLSGGADLSMSNGSYVFENNVSFGHIDVRPGSTTDSTVSFEDMVFTSKKLNPTYGPCTDRVESVVEFTPGTGGRTTFLFKNCIFNNAQVVFEGLSGQLGYFTATFENCTFNNLGTSAGIYVQNYLDGSIKVKDCTFNYTATASASAVSTSSSTVTIAVEGTNAVNGTAATAYTHNPEIGEDNTYDIKIMNPSVKVISVGSNTTVSGLDTVTVSGIATK